MIQSETDDNGVSIELTPIIDMVFLLLIFFLVATTFQQTEREMQIALPQASSAGPISAAMRDLIINIDKDGRMIVNGNALAAEEIRNMIETLVESNPDQKVTIRGDRDATYATIVVALDLCKGAGIQQPYLDTVLTN